MVRMPEPWTISKLALSTKAIRVKSTFSCRESDAFATGWRQRRRALTFT
jgi:hypothetical protein